MSTDNTVDVVVLGGGIAGFRAALVAASHGAKTLLLEKMPQTGGSSIQAAGFFAFAGTASQQERKFEDSDELLRRDLFEVGEHANDPALVEAFIARQLDEYNYLRSLGVEFVDVQPSSGHSVPRGHWAKPAQFMKLLADAAAKSPLIEVRTGAQGKRLVRGANGRISGVEVQADGKTYTVNAKKGVILATGGFSRSKDLLSLFAPTAIHAVPAGGKGNEGDGFRLGWEHGAAFADLGYLNGTFGTYPKPAEDESPFTIYPMYRGAIIVNLKGDRFADESKSYKTLGGQTLAQDQGLAFQIFDDAVMQQSGEWGSYNFKKVLDMGRIASAPSIAELAVKVGLPPEKLSRTVEAYNRDAENGVDQLFGRKALSHTLGKLVPLTKPPFYAYQCTAMISSTYGGLKVDAGMRVVNVWGEPIVGLYAAGEVMGGFHGASYMTGSALSKALVFGRIAADSACADS